MQAALCIQARIMWAQLFYLGIIDFGYIQWLWHWLDSGEKPLKPQIRNFESIYAAIFAGPIVSSMKKSS